MFSFRTSAAEAQGPTDVSRAAVGTETRCVAWGNSGLDFGPRQQMSVYLLNR